MNAKEYLGQAYRLDQRIASKLDQVASLNDLAAKYTSTLTGMPHSPNRGTSTMADAVAKILDLQAEINRDIDDLVDLKRDITGCIMSVQNMEYQSLLEKRYLCLMTWEQIAAENGCSVRNIHMMHGEALKKVVVPENLH